jgi:dihydroxyacetone kinase-like predicted kinase
LTNCSLGLEIKPGQIIGLLDGKLKAVAEKPADVIFALLDMINTENCRIITVYYGKDIKEAEADRITAKIAKAFPHVSAGAVNGGQPEYHYIISVE